MENVISYPKKVIKLLNKYMEIKKVIHNDIEYFLLHDIAILCGYAATKNLIEHCDKETMIKLQTKRKNNIQLMSYIASDNIKHILKKIGNRLHIDIKRKLENLIINTPQTNNTVQNNIHATNNRLLEFVTDITSLTNIANNAQIKINTLNQIIIKQENEIKTLKQLLESAKVSINYQQAETTQECSAIANLAEKIRESKLTPQKLVNIIKQVAQNEQDCINENIKIKPKPKTKPIKEKLTTCYNLNDVAKLFKISLSILIKNLIQYNFLHYDKNNNLDVNQGYISKGYFIIENQTHNTLDSQNIFVTDLGVKILKNRFDIKHDIVITS